MDAGDDLVRATAEIVRPLVKRLLAANVPFGRVESRLRELFVEIAEHEFALAHRPQTDSRSALLTRIASTSTVTSSPITECRWC